MAFKNNQLSAEFKEGTLYLYRVRRTDAMDATKITGCGHYHLFNNLLVVIISALKACTEHYTQEIKKLKLL